MVNLTRPFIKALLKPLPRCSRRNIIRSLNQHYSRDMPGSYDTFISIVQFIAYSISHAEGLYGESQVPNDHSRLTAEKFLYVYQKLWAESKCLLGVPRYVKNRADSVPEKRNEKFYGYSPVITPILDNKNRLVDFHFASDLDARKPARIDREIRQIKRYLSEFYSRATDDQEIQSHAKNDFIEETRRAHIRYVLQSKLDFHFFLSLAKQNRINTAHRMSEKNNNKDSKSNYANVSDWQREALISHLWDLLRVFDAIGLWFKASDTDHCAQTAAFQGKRSAESALHELRALKPLSFQVGEEIKKTAVGLRIAFDAVAIATGLVRHHLRSNEKYLLHFYSDIIAPSGRASGSFVALAPTLGISQIALLTPVGIGISTTFSLVSSIMNLVTCNQEMKMLENEHEYAMRTRVTGASQIAILERQIFEHAYLQLIDEQQNNINQSFQSGFMSTTAILTSLGSLGVGGTVPALFAVVLTGPISFLLFGLIATHYLLDSVDKLHIALKDMFHYGKRILSETGRGYKESSFAAVCCFLSLIALIPVSVLRPLSHIYQNPIAAFTIFYNAYYNHMQDSFRVDKHIFMVVLAVLCLASFVIRSVTFTVFSLFHAVGSLFSLIFSLVGGLFNKVIPRRKMHTQYSIHVPRFHPISRFLREMRRLIQRPFVTLTMMFRESQQINARMKNIENQETSVNVYQSRNTATLSKSFSTFFTIGHTEHSSSSDSTHQTEATVRLAHGMNAEDVCHLLNTRDRNVFPVEQLDRYIQQYNSHLSGKRHHNVHKHHVACIIKSITQLNPNKFNILLHLHHLEHDRLPNAALNQQSPSKILGHSLINKSRLHKIFSDIKMTMINQLTSKKMKEILLDEWCTLLSESGDSVLKEKLCVSDDNASSLYYWRDNYLDCKSNISALDCIEQRRLMLIRQLLVLLHGPDLPDQQNQLSKNSRDTLQQHIINLEYELSLSEIFIDKDKNQRTRDVLIYARQFCSRKLACNVAATLHKNYDKRCAHSAIIDDGDEVFHHYLAQSLHKQVVSLPRTTTKSHGLSRR